MARAFAKAFYSSKQWQACRDAYAASVGGLCEICLAQGRYTPGEIVHHKIHIEPENLTDPNIALNWANLQLVCRDCHAQLHKTGTVRRYKVDSFGKIL